MKYVEIFSFAQTKDNNFYLQLNFMIYNSNLLFIKILNLSQVYYLKSPITLKLLFDIFHSFIHVYIILF